MAEQFQNLAGFVGTEGDDPTQPGNVAFLNSRQVKSWMELFQRERTTVIMQPPKCTVASGQQVKISVGDELSYVESIKAVEVNGRKSIAPQQKTCEVGLRAKVLPVVSADRRFVRLNYALTLTSVDENIPLLPVQFADAADGSLFPVRGNGASVPVQSAGSPDGFTIFIQKPRIATLTLDKTVMIPDGGTAVFYLGKTLVEDRNEYGPPILSKIPYLSRLFTNFGYGHETRHVFLVVTTHVIENNDAGVTNERSK